MAARWIFPAAASHRTPAACSLLLLSGVFLLGLWCAHVIEIIVLNDTRSQTSLVDGPPPLAPAVKVERGVLGSYLGAAEPAARVLVPQPARRLEQRLAQRLLRRPQPALLAQVVVAHLWHRRGKSSERVRWRPETFGERMALATRGVAALSERGSARARGRSVRA